MFLFFLLMANLASNLAVAASNSGFVYSGRILKPDGTPINSGNIAITVSVYSPTNNCLLYQEQFSGIDMNNKMGTFSVTLGLPTPAGTRLDSNAYTFNQLISNAGATFTGLTCASGTTYSPASNDERILRATFNDGTTVVSTVDLAIKSVPYAMQAAEVSGYGIMNLAKISGAGSATVLTPAEYNFMQSFAANLVAATCLPNQVVRMNAGGTAFECAAAAGGESTTVTNLGVTGAAIGSLSGSAVELKKLIGTANQVTVTQNANDITFSLPAAILGQPIAAPTGAEAGQAIRWNAGGTAWEYFTPSTGTLTSFGIATNSDLVLSNSGTASAPILQIANGSATGQSLYWDQAATDWKVGAVSYPHAAGSVGNDTLLIGNTLASDQVGTLAAAAAPSILMTAAATNDIGWSTGGNNQVLKGGAAGVSWGAVDISTADVTGTLPVNKGGTGQSSFVTGEILVGNTTGNTLSKVTMGGDATVDATGSVTVQGFRTKALEATAPTVDGQIYYYDQTSGTWKLSKNTAATTDGQVLKWNATNKQWEVGTDNDSGTTAWQLGGNAPGATGVFGTTTNQDISVITNNTAKMTILKTGEVGIGTSSPSRSLEIATSNGLYVNSTAASWGGNIYLNGPDAGSVSRIRYSQSGQPNAIFALRDESAGQDRIYINSSGNIGIANTSPGSKFSVNTPTTAIANTEVQITATAATQKPLVIQGAAAQSAYLQEWQNSAGTTLAYMNSGGMFVTNSQPIIAGGYLATNTGYVLSSSSSAERGLYLHGGDSAGNWAATTSASSVTINGTFNPTTSNAKLIGLTVTPTINQTGTANGDYTGLLVNVLETAATGTNKNLIEAQVSGVTKFRVDNTGKIYGDGSGLTGVSASGVLFSGLTAAAGTNTIDNTNFAQTWNWSTATTENPLTVNANALTSGSILTLATSNATVNSTNGLLNVANTGASTNGVLARFQSNSTAGSGLTVLANGNVGVGTASPTYSLDVTGNMRTQAADGHGITLTGGSNTTSLNLASASTSTIKWNGSTAFTFNGSIIFNQDLVKASGVVIRGMDNAAGAGQLSLDLRGGNASSAAAGGGNINITGGTGGSGGTGNYNGGSILIDGGLPSGTGTIGNILIGSTRGNVGIGTASPTAKLYVEESVDANRVALIAKTKAGSNVNTQEWVDRNGLTTAWMNNMGQLTADKATLRSREDGTGIVLQFYDTVGSRNYGKIDAIRTGGSGQGSLRFFHALNGTETEAMRIYHDGNVGIGTTSPTAALHLKAGTATAGTAPLKFTSGVNLTTPEAGAVEFDGTNLYFTDSTNTRRTLATTGGVSGSYVAKAGDTMTGPLVNNSNSASTALAVTQSGAGYAATFMGGNVGIGTTTPGAKLAVTDNTNNQTANFDTSMANGNYISFSASGVSKGLFGQGSTLFTNSGTGIRSGAGVPISFSINSATPSMTIETSGKVGIGTTAPQAQLHTTVADQNTFSLRVSNSTYAAPATHGHDLLMYDNGTLQWYLPDNGTTPGDFQFYSRDTASVVMKVGSNGNVGIGTASPTEVLTVVAPGTGATAKNTIRLGSNGWDTPKAQNAALDGGVKLHLYDSGSQKLQIGMNSSAEMWFNNSGTATDGYGFYTQTDNTTNPTLKFKISKDGNVTINGNATVTGTLTAGGSTTTGQRKLTYTVTAGNIKPLLRLYAGEGTVATLIQVQSNTSAHSGTKNYIFQGGFSQISTSWWKMAPYTVGRGHGDSTNGFDLYVRRGADGYTYEFGAAANTNNKILITTFTDLTAGSMTITDISAAAEEAQSSAGDVYSHRTLLAEGNVGIGTTSPAEKLTIDGNFRLLSTGNSIYANDNFSIKDTADSNRNRFVFSQSNYYETRSGGNHIFSINGTEKMRLNSSGQLGVGVIPTSDLQVMGTGTEANPSKIYVHGSDGTTAGDAKIILGQNNGGTDLVLHLPGTDARGDGLVANDSYITSSQRLNLMSRGNNPVTNTGITIGSDIGSTYSGISFKTNTVGNAASTRMVISDIGNVGIGTTSPTAALHLKAGTATANTAPLKFTSGVNLTTPEAGAVEFDGTNLYFTDSTNTRRTLATTTSVSGSYVAKAGDTMTGQLAIHFGAAATPNNAITIQNNAGTHGNIGIGSGGGLDINSGASAPIQIRQTAAQPIILSTNNTEQVRIKSDGKIGIGTNNPQFQLDLFQTADPTIALHDNTVAGGTYGGAIRGGSVTAQGGRLRLGTLENNTFQEAITVNHQAYVGIGVASPVTKFEITNGYFRATDGTNTPPTSGKGAEIVGTSGNAYFMGYDRTATSFIPVYIRGSQVTINDQSDGNVVFFGGATTTGKVGLGETSPTRRLVVRGQSDGTAAPSDSGTKTSTLLLTSGSGNAGDGGGLEFGFGSGTYAQPYFASIKGYGTSASNNTLGDIVFYNRAASTDTSLTENMRIKSDGKVGIGNTTPAAPLHVKAPVLAGNHSARNISLWSDFYNAGANGHDLALTSLTNGTHFQGWNFSSDWGGRLSFGIWPAASYSTTPNEYLTIINNGNVGIGTTAPTSTLHVVGTGVTMTKYGVDGGYSGVRYNGTVGSPTQVLANERINYLIGTAYYTGGTSGLSNIAGISMYAAENQTDVARGSFMTFETSALGATSRSERVRIDPSGNVGIGTTGPAQKLEVAGNVNVGAQYTRTTASTNRGQLAQASTYVQTVNANTTVDWNDGNIQEINTFACNGAKTITFSNVRDGAAYTLLLSGTAAHSGTCVFVDGGGRTFKTSGGAAAPTASKDVLFTFAVINNIIVYGMTDNLQ